MRLWKFICHGNFDYKILVRDTYQGIRVYFIDDQGGVDYYDTYWSEIDDYKRIGLCEFIEEFDLNGKINRELFF